MTQIVYLFFSLSIFSGAVLSDDSGEEAQVFIFGDIFKSIPTLFEYLLQMVEERPEVLESNNIELMKRDIELNNCDHAKCDHVKREVGSNMRLYYDNHDTDSLESEQVMDRILNNVEIHRTIYTRHETECDNPNEVTALKSCPTLSYISSNLKKRKTKVLLNDETKRDSYHKVCSKSLSNVNNKRNVKNSSYNINNTKLDTKQNNDAIRSNDKAQYNSTKKVISNNSAKRSDNIYKPDKDNTLINKKEEEYSRQTRYKKLASDFNTFSLTPEEVEEHIFKVDQMLEEYKRNQTM